MLMFPLLYTHPSQGNNSFIFPGVGLAAVVTKAERVNDKMFYLASKTLGECAGVSFA